MLLLSLVLALVDLDLDPDLFLLDLLLPFDSSFRALGVLQEISTLMQSPIKKRPFIFEQA